MELLLGAKASFSKTITETDVVLFAGLSGDLNPIHIDNEYAKNSYFKKRLVHGALVGAFISNVLANKLPGPGTIYISQTYNFKAPVFINDTITAIVEVVELDGKKCRLKTFCKNQDDRIVIDGEALVSPPRG